MLVKKLDLPSNSRTTLLRCFISNQAGMAVIEMIPMLLVTVLFFGFSLGFFGIIHSGVLNSVGARNYTFETFMNKSNLIYFRTITDTKYDTVGARIHGIRSERGQGLEWQATSRPILPFGTIAQVEEQSSVELHNQQVFQVQDGRRYTDEGVSSVWIQSVYGICLWSSCEPK
jgi:hypothetical protein